MNAPVQEGIAARRILMTGGDGFVGRHLRELLAKVVSSGCRIIVAGRDPTCDVLLDLGDAATVEAAVRHTRPDLVLHLAGEASVAGAARDVAEAWRVNLLGTLALARAFAEVSPEGAFFYTSSAEVYGEAFLDGMVDEATRPAPNSAYGETKLAAEYMLARVLPATARLIVARPTNHLGPRQDQRFALASFAHQIAQGEERGAPMTIDVGNLEAARDFMDVRDVVRAYVALLAMPRQGGARATYNIASGRTRTVRELLDMLRAHAKVSTETRVDPARQRPNDIPVAEVDAALLRLSTGWKPGYPIEQTIVDVLDDARVRLTG